MSDQRQWHRLFGMSWTDLLTDQPATVETEMDLSVQKQLLDVVIVRRMAEPLTVEVPDGFDDMAAHNLISFKSFQETLEPLALDELVGRYIDYRKLVSPTTDRLLPAEDFRRYLVCVRFPQNLSRDVLLEQLQEGVYQARHFSCVLRVIVVHQLPQVARNGVLHLYSAQPELVRYGARVAQPRNPRTSSFLNQLFDRYREDGAPMPFTVEEFERQGLELLARDPQMVKRVLDTVPTEELLERALDEKRLEGVPPETVLANLTPQQLEKLRELLRARDEAAGQS